MYYSLIKIPSVSIIPLGLVIYLLEQYIQATMKITPTMTVTITVAFISLLLPVNYMLKQEINQLSPDIQGKSIRDSER